jgi:hypothetical protein
MKHNDSGVMANNSLSDPGYQQNLAEKFQKIHDAFKRIDRSGDDIISQQELSDFLDTNMPVKILI